MKFVSYNVNGIRAALRKGLIDWIDKENPDVICIQEIKAREEDVDLSDIMERGYIPHWHSAEKRGYSGVLTLSKQNPDQVLRGMGIGEFDSEGRILRTDYGQLTLLNCYFPSGTSGDHRQAIKMKFLDEFFVWAHQLKKTRPNLIVAGDYNIAHTEIDIHNPVQNKNTSGFKPEERDWMSKWFDSGFTDPFRLLHEDKIEYSWWSYRAAARKRNKGWRIDYISTSDNLSKRIVSLRHANEAVHSDHCPVVLELGI